MVIDDSGMVPWFERLREEIPDLEPLDVHTHIGFNDPDGYRCSREQLMESLAKRLTRQVRPPTTITSSCA